MEIIVNRHTFTDKSTIGDFMVDGERFCYSLEDMVREPGVKVAGQTAIPEGKYRVIIDQSARFNRAMPHILDVENFEGVRIHNGNRPEDTEGCILLGFTKDTDFVGQSVSAFNKFFDLLYLALRDQEAWITIGRAV
jgi:hypothetical protein